MEWFSSWIYRGPHFTSICSPAKQIRPDALLKHKGRKDDTDSGKPGMIAFYNSTKEGVDTVDQLCANYSCSRRSRRWHIVIFFTIILNVSAGVNGYILHQSYSETARMSRMDFMKELAKSMVFPPVERRLQSGYIGQELKLSFKRILYVEEAATLQNEDFFENRRRCGFRSPRLGRKTKYPCNLCGVPIV